MCISVFWTLDQQTADNFRTFYTTKKEMLTDEIRLRQGYVGQAKFFILYFLQATH